MRPVVPLSSARRPFIATIMSNRLELFGGAVLHTAVGPITGRAAQRHRIALLALLATTRRLYRSRDQLVALLWPDVDAERGRRLLSDSIYRVNQALGGDAVTGPGEDVRINRGQLGSDVADFEAAIEARDWQRAVSLHTGPFLDGFFLPDTAEFDQWLEPERTRYAQNVARALEALAVEARDGGRWTDAADWWRRVAAHAPDDSRIAIELMRALEQSGNRAAALRHARVHAVLLNESLGVEPDRAVQELAAQIAGRNESSVERSPAVVPLAVERIERIVPQPCVDTSPVPPNSIAVLPFDNLSECGTSGRFADGVSDEVMYRLARTPGVRVASRRSAFAYRDLRLDVREVGRRLNVAWILEGSVRRSGGMLRIAAQLTDATNGYQVWSECYDRSPSDLFTIQAEIAAAIASSLTPAVG